MKYTIAIVMAALAIAAPASAQTMYRCYDLGRTIYSDKPCLNGDEVKQMAQHANPPKKRGGRGGKNARGEERRPTAGAPPAKRDGEMGRAARCVRAPPAPGCDP